MPDSAGLAIRYFWDSGIALKTGWLLRNEPGMARLLSFSGKQKGHPVGGGLFLSYSLFLEYQIQRGITPNIMGLFGLETVWNEEQHFGTVGKKLDKVAQGTGISV
jgi:hypothetical protein